MPTSTVSKVIKAVYGYKEDPLMTHVTVIVPVYNTEKYIGKMYPQYYFTKL